MTNSSESGDGDQPVDNETAESPEGYKWWQWVLAILALWPLFPMLVAILIPSTRSVLTPKRIWAGFALLLLMAFVVFIIAAVIAGVSEDRAIPEQPPNQVIAPTPSETPTPPATATPIPTRTPAPTPTPTSCPTPEEQAYFLEMGSLADSVSEVFFGFGNLNTRAGDNPSLILQEDWQLEAALYLIGFQFYIDAVKELSPPSSLRHIHQNLLASVNVLQKAVDAYAYGVDNLDVDSLVQAISYLEEHNRLVNENLEPVAQFCK